MSAPIRVLLVEDNPGDARLLHVMLMEGTTQFECEDAETLLDGLEKLRQGSYDIVLLDLSLPDSQGPETFLKVRGNFPDLPVVLLTGLNDEELGVKAMREGVQDYLVKGQVNSDLLVRSIRYAIERKSGEKLLFATQKAMMSSAKLAALGTLAGGVAHEINTPLSVISLLAIQAKEATQRADVDSAQIIKSLQAIVDNVSRISKITQGLRIIARESIADPTVPTPILNIVENTLLLCKYRLAKSNIRVGYHIPENLSISCRANEISHLLLSLLINAADAVEHCDLKWIEIGASDREQHVEITVTDSGTGIEKEIADHIFDPFFTTKGIGKGWGLGLSISRGLMAGHGGDLFLDENSANTKFVMRFPKA